METYSNLSEEKKVLLIKILDEEIIQWKKNFYKQSAYIEKLEQSHGEKLINANEKYHEQWEEMEGKWFERYSNTHEMYQKYLEEKNDKIAELLVKNVDLSKKLENNNRKLKSIKEAINGLEIPFYVRILVFDEEDRKSNDQDTIYKQDI